jgi:PTS system nitrogen regulatory IIA component
MVEIADILTPDDVVLDLRTCHSKRQVLKELADHAATAVNLDPQRLLEALLERERLGTTGIGHGIAIPHARMAELKRLVGLFARLDEPVDFEALDDQPSDLIFLLLAPDSADAESLKALARISRVLRDPNLQLRLRREKDRNAVYQMLTRKPETHAA